MRDQARRRGADADLWRLTGQLHDLDYERHPDLRPGIRAHAMAELERARVPAGVRASPRTPTTWACRARARWSARSRRSTSSSGFVLACAYVRAGTG